MKEAQCNVEEGWRHLWRTLFHEGASLLYDYVSSFHPAKRFLHLPTVEEISVQYPNTNGWGTGMENSMINGGTLLAALCDRYLATGEKALKKEADALFKGIVLCGTLSSKRGLILRSVSPFDNKSHYIETSLDQITHFSHGCWKFYDSDLSSCQQRDRMREMMTSLSEMMVERIKPENGYHVGKENGEPGIYDKMWNVAPHEPGRLPMVYGITWHMTGDERWRELFFEYAGPAAEVAERLDYSKCVVYGLFQHQVSMEVIVALTAENKALNARWRRLMEGLADYAGSISGRYPPHNPVDINKIDMDWRHWSIGEYYLNVNYRVPVMPATLIENEWRPLSECGQALLIQMMFPGRILNADQRGSLQRLLLQTDFNRAITEGMIYPLAAWWRFMLNTSSG